jgi:hypothetical protein
MRFRRWHRPEPYGDTSRKRAAFLRKQRLHRESLPLFADEIASQQHSVDEEMARRAIWWAEAEHHRRHQRAARWRDARARLFAMPDALRRRVREIWRTCPYPADPASFADFLYQIEVGKLDPQRPPWVFHPTTSARITANPATFGEAFRRIGRRRTDLRGTPLQAEELLFCGNLGSGILFLASSVRSLDPAAGFLGSSHLAVPNIGRSDHWVDIEIRGECSDADLALIERLAQASETRPVAVRRAPSMARQIEGRAAR